MKFNPINMTALKKCIKSGKLVISREPIEEDEYFFLCAGYFILAFPCKADFLFNDLKYLFCGRDGNVLKVGEQITYSDGLGSSPSETQNADLKRFITVQTFDPVEVTDFHVSLDKYKGCRVLIADNKPIVVQQCLLDIVPDTTYLTTSQTKNALVLGTCDGIKIGVLPIHVTEKVNKSRLEALADVRVGEEDGK
jgi:hypothetical protein